MTQNQRRPISIEISWNLTLFGLEKRLKSPGHYQTCDLLMHRFIDFNPAPLWPNNEEYDANIRTVSVSWLIAKPVVFLKTNWHTLLQQSFEKTKTKKQHNFIRINKHRFGGAWMPNLRTSLIESVFDFGYFSWDYMLSNTKIIFKLSDCKM